MSCHPRAAGKIGGNGERVLLTPRILHELVFHEVKRKSGEQGERRYNGGNNPAPRGFQPMGIERADSFDHCKGGGEPEIDPEQHQGDAEDVGKH